MRWLIDEGLPKYVVDRLRSRGDDVLDASEPPDRGRPDQELWQRAGREGRLLITRDLGFLWPGLSPAPTGVVLVRVPDEWQAQQISRLLEDSLGRLGAETLVGNVTVVEPGRMRQRRLGEITKR